MVNIESRVNANEKNGRTDDENPLINLDLPPKIFKAIDLAIEQSGGNMTSKEHFGLLAIIAYLDNLNLLDDIDILLEVKASLQLQKQSNNSEKS